MISMLSNTSILRLFPSEVLFKIATSKARKHTIKILANYIWTEIFFNKTTFTTIDRIDWEKIYQKLWEKFISIYY